MNPWDEVLAKVEAKVNRHSFATWFRPTQFLRQDGRSLLVRVPNPQFKEWLAKNYHGVILEALSEVGRGDLQIAFDCEPEAPAAAAASPERDGAALATLNPKYTFESFVVGSSNQFAHAASRAARPPGSASAPPPGRAGGAPRTAP